MALNQVGARTESDVYRVLFFWQRKEIGSLSETQKTQGQFAAREAVLGGGR